MKQKLQITLIMCISLLFVQLTKAELPTKNLGTPVYNGQGNPKDSKFVQLNTIVDSVTYTQQTEGMNIVTKSAQWIPVTWYATSDSGFVANGPYTVEAKVAIHKSMKNGFFLEMQGTPGKRFKIDIDTTAIYNMTYSPSTAKEIIANNLDNRGMHTYRVAVDNSDIAHIYRDGLKIGAAHVDGLVSSSAYYKDIEVIQEDQFFENYISSYNPAFPTPLNYTAQAALRGSLANYDITYSSWASLGIDTAKANVKVGNTSIWFNNGSTGELKIKKTGLTAGKYKLSFWSKTKSTGEAYKGSVTLIGTDPNRPAVKFKGTQIDSIPAYVGTDPHVTILASQVLVPDNRSFGYREYQFDLTRDGDIWITFHNGWANNQKPGWANMWIDDLRIAKVEPVPFIRFGKDSEAGVTDFTLKSLTYDMTGAYAPAPNNPINLTVQIGSEGVVKENNVTLTNGAVLVVNEGDTKTFAFTPNYGYEVDTLTMNNVNVKSQLSNNLYTTSAINSVSNLKVTFKRIQYVLSIKDAVSGSIDLLSDYGATPTFKFTPTLGWKINSVIYNSVDVTNNLINDVYTVPAIIANGSLNVSFVSTATGMPQFVNGKIKVYTNQSEIVVEGTASGETVHVFSETGVLLQSLQSKGDGIVIPVQRDAVYLVKTSNMTFKVVL